MLLLLAIVSSIVSVQSSTTTTLAPPPWGGTECGTGRRRRQDGAPAQCDCIAVTKGFCTKYYDDCCEPFSFGCCRITTVTSTTTVTTASFGDSESYCPWLTTTLEFNEFVCIDGKFSSNMTLCAERGGVRKCPPNIPVLCADGSCRFFDCNVSGTGPSPELCLVPGVLGSLGISAGGSHSVFLRLDGVALATGYNLQGQLADGTTVEQLTAEQVFTNAIAIAANYHTLFVDAANVAWAAGQNDFGQLCDGTRSDRSQRASVMHNVRTVAAGFKHSLFLLNDGTVWACGANADGQLGDGTTVNRLLPVQIFSNAIAISAGRAHSIFVQRNGNAWSTGMNTCGQLGDGTQVSRLSPVMVTLPGQVKAISAGSSHTMYLLMDGTVVATGCNNGGQLGDGSQISKATPSQVFKQAIAISAGTLHSLFLKSDGTAWGTGYNHDGQLGDGTRTNRLSPVQVLEGVRAVSAGDVHSLFIRNDGSAWATGNNDHGQLGDATQTRRTSAVFTTVLWIQPQTTSTTTTSVTRTSTLTKWEVCSNQIPLDIFLQSTTPTGLENSGNLWSSQQLSSVFASSRWQVGESWTFALHASSSDTTSRTFTFFGGGLTFLNFTIAPGEKDILVFDRIRYQGNDTRVMYTGPDKVGDMVLTQVFLAPGICRNHLFYHYGTSPWSDCSATCYGQGRQTRVVNCIGSDDKEYYDGPSCLGLDRPAASQLCNATRCTARVTSSSIPPTVVVMPLLALALLLTW